MSQRLYTPPGTIRSVADFKAHSEGLGLSLPCDDEVQHGPESPLARPITLGGREIGNRFCIHPMEGWDGTADGRPTEHTLRRWRHFGRSGAKLIWGGEAVAVRHDGRANPNQLLLNEETKADMARLRETLVEAHREACGTTDGLFVGLQLTHSGRYSRPEGRAEPRILYRHPVLDSRLGLSDDYPVMTDGEVRQVVDEFHRAAGVARRAGFDFVDVKHCHGYLGHEFLSARARGRLRGGLREPHALPARGGRGREGGRAGPRRGRAPLGLRHGPLPPRPLGLVSRPPRPRRA